MFRNPINAFPYANAVDLTTSGNQVPFSFTFQGDVIRQWCVEIKDIDTDTVYYTTDVQDNIATPEYNGDICTVTLTVGSDITATTAITNFSWSLYMNDSTTLMTAGAIKTNSGTYQSNEFYFINCDKPTATFTINNTTVTSDEYTLKNRVLNLTGSYTASTPIKYYQISLFVNDDISDNLIFEGEKEFSQNINFSYSGFDTTKVEGVYINSYTLVITLANQYDLTNVYTISIVLDYEDDIDTESQVEPICVKEKAYNLLTWQGNKVAMGEASGQYTLLNEGQTPVPDTTRVRIDTGTITYDDMSGIPLQVADAENCSVSFVVTIPLEVASLSRSTTVATVKIQGFGTYQFRCQNNRFLCSIGKTNYVGTRTRVLKDFSNTSLVPPKFPIQTNFEEDYVYTWYDDTDSAHEWKNNSTTYWFTDSVVTVWVLLQPAAGSPNADHIETEIV